jgi:hypothetical protein
LPLPGSDPVTYGSVNRLGFEQDRIVIAHGRLPNPRNTHDFVMDATTAKEWGYHLGERVTFGLYSDPQSLSNAYFNNQLRPRSSVTLTLVGIGTADAFDVVQDQSDTANSALVLFTPALAQRLLDCCASDTNVGLHIEGGSQSVNAVEVDLEHLLAKHGGQAGGGTALSAVSARAQRAVRPESTALEVFGGIAALATLIIAGQLMARRLRFDGDDLAAMRALGADPTMTVFDGLLGVLGAVVAGTALACVVAVALSPLAPLGSLRQYLPIGLHVDWVVIGLGLAVMLIGLSSVALLFAYRGAPHREASRPARIGSRGQHTSRAAAAVGLPVPAVIGIRFALEPGAGRNAVPVRSAILGSVLAVVILTTTLTFGASLHALVTHPALYGWNWNYEFSGNGGDLPTPVEPLLDKDHLIASWSSAYFGDLIIDGQHVPVLGDIPGPRVAPPLLSGHALEASDQVVLGAVTLEELHKHVGDTVEVSASGKDPVRLSIVGTATMPATGGGPGAPHLEMGTGAILSYRLIPAGERNPFDQPQAGPNAIFIRDKPGTSGAAMAKSISSIIVELGGQPGAAPILGPQRPAESLTTAVSARPRPTWALGWPSEPWSRSP